MKRSDEILQKAFGRGLTMSERVELREAYNWEQSQDDSARHHMKESVKDFKDNTNDQLNMPRHRVLPKFPHMQECPFCFKMRGYNLSSISERNYMDRNPDDFCMKTSIHTEKAMNIMISRERIDLDAKENV
jgi:hypothetical protein